MESDIENGWGEPNYDTDIVIQHPEHPTIWGQISNFIRDIIDERPILPIENPILTSHSYENVDSIFYNELWGNEDIVILTLE